MGNKHLLTSSLEIKVVAITDGTHSTAELAGRDWLTPWADWTSMGRGEARRAKGDPRNAQIGQAIALQRALQEAADMQKEAIKDNFGLEL